MSKYIASLGNNHPSGIMIAFSQENFVNIAATTQEYFYNMIVRDLQSNNFIQKEKLN